MLKLVEGRQLKNLRNSIMTYVKSADEPLIDLVLPNDVAEVTGLYCMPM